MLPDFSICFCVLPKQHYLYPVKIERYAALLFLMLEISCQGKLTEEQKAEMRKEMRAHAIRKMTEAEITEAAFALGRTISHQIDTSQLSLSDSLEIDNIEHVHQVIIRPLRTGDSLLREIERQIIDAYTSPGEVAVWADNVQKISADTLLYTRPMVREHPDGSVMLDYVLGIRMARRQVILFADSL